MALINKLSAIGDAIREKSGTTALMTLDEMPEAIAAIETGGGGGIEIEPIVLTGYQYFGCAGALSGMYIKLFGDTISTNNIYESSSMFNGNTAEKIPFEINMRTDGNYHNMASMFSNCENLKELPKVNNAYPASLQNMFSNSFSLREIPDDFFDSWNFERTQTYTYSNNSNMFSSCFSLRKISENFLKQLHSKAAYYNQPYNSLFSVCSSLDEVNSLGVSDTVALTTNIFSSTVSSCYRIKTFTFNLNEDGTPKTAQWKGQTLDFSNLGTASSIYKDKILNYNSGITKDKEVNSIETYATLKNDPDWFTFNNSFSRYNHNSAVATINSLPDASAYLATAGGTNTIKFKGIAGELTDGGAINTLTEAEIAVAAAKGWTVTLV